ncbi:MAG: nucleotidyltransferase family protein [Planctomycetes bacterium]|nr:nucleotidyltransferase family protein [Planctomycetota bacterium]
MLTALIPAAGKSTRMGRPKLALPLGGATVLEQVVAACRGAGVQEVLVVVGPHLPELVPLAQRAGARVLVLAEETPDMRTTVERGLDWIAEHRHPQAGDSWLLVPADHPTLRAEVIRQLLQARADHPHSSIVVPTFQGQRGHPVLIGWEQVAGIKTLPVGQGLNVYLRGQAAVTREVPVAFPEVLWDLDTPEDYESLRQRWGEEGPWQA